MCTVMGPSERPMHVHVVHAVLLVALPRLVEDRDELTEGAVSAAKPPKESAADNVAVGVPVSVLMQRS